MINVEDSVTCANFLNNDVKLAYCLRGSKTIALCDLNTDNYTQLPDLQSDEGNELINTFQNKQGEAFYAKGSLIHKTAPTELRNIDGTPLALIESDPSNKFRYVSLYGTQVVALGQKRVISVFEEHGTLSWAKDYSGEGAYSKMMEDELHDDGAMEDTGIKSGNKHKKMNKRG